MSDSDVEKELPPTQKKLDDARKKGEIPRSADLNVAASYGGLLLAMLALGAAGVDIMGTAMAATLDRADTMSALWFAGSGTVLAGGLSVATFKGAAPFLLIPGGCVLLCLFAMRGIVFAPTRLAPKLNRVSPLSNAKNKFGRSGLFEFAKSFSKLSLYSIVLAIFLTVKMPDILSVVHQSPGIAMMLMTRLLIGFFALVLAVSLALAVIDVFWQHAEHIRKNRMSHTEMKEEMKKSEGDPAMKQARRQKGYDIATNRMMAEVPKADVIVVNPTHYAVALKWDRAGGGAPTCIAKGTDEVARRIREAGAEHGIPIHSDPPAARAMHATLEIGQEIHPDHYRAVAAAIRFADRIRDRMETSA